MIDAINGLTVFQFILFVLATLATVIQLALLVALATHVHRIKVYWGMTAVVLWIVLFAVTR